MKKRDREILHVFLLVGWMVSGLPVSAVQMIADRHFQDGVDVLAPADGTVEGMLQYKEPYGATRWQLAQWSSQESVYGTDPTGLSSGSMQWKNPYKRLVMGPLGSSDGDLVLALDSVAEYGGVYRQAGEAWPHILVQQDITNPNGWFKAYGPSVADLHELIVDVELRLNYIDSIYTSGYSPGLHAAQFLLYFTVQNLNPSSSGYGDYLWFGLRFYDDRDPLPDPYVAGDGGTGKLIYNIGASPYWSTGMQTGVWKRATVNILPDIEDALQEAWNRGYLTGSSDIADYKIGGMNMGWEVPGLSDAAMQIRNFGVQAYGLDFAKPYEFNIDGESDGWGFSNMVEVGSGGALDGKWMLAVPGADPQLIGPEMHLGTDRYKQVVVCMANMGNPAGNSTAQLFWRRSGDAGFSESRSVAMPVSNSGTYDKYTFDMDSNPEWNGEIVQLRLDPIVSGDGQPIGV
ncbi:MAG: hypothetical protein DRP64_04660, partial [Verrucomicrobia bacterium]